MLFLFLKYISPTWYYNLSTEASRRNPYFLDYRTLEPRQQALLDVDTQYRTEQGRLCDASYQILQKGIISHTASELPLDKTKNSPQRRTVHICAGVSLEVDATVRVKDVRDNYRFIRRFFSPMHAVQILLIRLFSLHNPFKEFAGFFASRKIKRMNLFSNNGYTLYQNQYENFQSQLVSRSPKVSVVIPTLNRYEYLRDVLTDLEKQDYSNFEVLVVDQSEPFQKTFYDGWKLDLQVEPQPEKALWLARNNAIKRAKGEYILLYDDDSRVENDWISQHLKCLDFFQCDISSGVSLSVVGAKIPPDYSFFKWSGQIDTGNVMFARSMMAETGMFDRQFEKQRQGDGEYGLRSYLYGKTNVSNPNAKRIHLKVATGGLRQMGSWDGLRPTKLFAPRPVPSIVYLCRKYFGDSSARLLLVMSVPTSLTPYKYKENFKMQLLSMLSLIVTFPVILTQVAISWNKAREKLKQGGIIERL